MRTGARLHPASRQRKRQAGAAGGEAGNYSRIWRDAAPAATGGQGTGDADAVGRGDDYGAGSAPHRAGERSDGGGGADSAGGGDCGEDRRQRSAGGAVCYGGGQQGYGNDAGRGTFSGGGSVRRLLRHGGQEGRDGGVSGKAAGSV